MVHKPGYRRVVQVVREGLPTDYVRVRPRTRFPPKPIFLFIDRGTRRGRKQRSTKIKLKKYRPTPAPDFGATPRGPPCFDRVLCLACLPFLACLHCLACIPYLAPCSKTLAGNARRHELGMLGRVDWDCSGVSTGSPQAYRLGMLGRIDWECSDVSSAWTKKVPPRIQTEPGQLFIFKR